MIYASIPGKFFRCTAQENFFVALHGKNMPFFSLKNEEN
jgi:hypothetical protein